MYFPTKYSWLTRLCEGLTIELTAEGSCDLTLLTAEGMSTSPSASPCSTAIITTHTTPHSLTPSLGWTSHHTSPSPSPITHHSSPITHHPSPITHHSSLITHHSSLITHTHTHTHTSHHALRTDIFSVLQVVRYTCSVGGQGCVCCCSELGEWSPLPHTTGGSYLQSSPGPGTGTPHESVLTGI